MTIHLIRHAKAGSRARWEQPDAQRPLSPAGAAQAVRLGDLLADAGISRLVASPSLRCRQTLEPLGARLGLDVGVDAALAEGASGATALDALLAMAAIAPDLAACSHGDVIPEVVRLLADRGVEVEGGASVAKAGRVALEVRRGAVSAVRCFPPPA